MDTRHFRLGGFSLSRFDRGRHMSLRAAVYFLVGIVFGATISISYAGTTVPYRFNGMNVTREGGATYLRGTSPSEVAAAGVAVQNAAIRASGSANWYSGTGALLQNGGVTFNAVLPLAATAASVAVTAVRANPAGLITSSVASYLLSKGIEYVNGQFQTSIASTAGVQPSTGLPDVCAGVGHSTNWQRFSWNICLATCGPGSGSWENQIYGAYNCVSTVPCAGGATLNDTTGLCVGGTQTRPTTEDDWTAARVGMWPDPAILDLVRLGVPLPTDKAQFTPPYKDVALEDPVVDPVTGKRVQQMARITPSPSSPDQADVQVVKQEVDSNGQPVINPTTGDQQPPEKETDLCKLHPDILACQTLDTPDGPELPNQDKNLSITPDTGWGPDTGTCPSDKVLNLRSGNVITIEYQPACQVATASRPVLIGFAWLAAILIAVGITRKYAE